MTSSRDLYETTEHFYLKIKGSRCAYCGERANTEDHVYPMHAMYLLVVSDTYQCNTLQSFIVPCCREYNILCSDQIFATFNIKREYLRETLRTRYKAELSYDWTMDDLISEEDHFILDKVLCMKERHRIENRLSHYHTYDIDVQTLPIASVIDKLQAGAVKAPPFKGRVKKPSYGKATSKISLN